MSSALIFQIQSIIVFSILTYGLIKKSNKVLHAKAMSIAIIWDILLVLQIELSRGAIAKASKVPANPFILNFHVGMAVTCVIGYLFMFYSGRFLKMGEFKLKSLHKKIGISTYILRLITLVTSYWAVVPKQ